MVCFFIFSTDSRHWGSKLELRLCLIITTVSEVSLFDVFLICDDLNAHTGLRGVFEFEVI